MLRNTDEIMEVKEDEFSQKLLELSATELYELQEKDPAINKFCHTNHFFQQKIKEQLSESHYLVTPLISRDQQKKLDAFDLYVAALFYSEYLAEPDEKLRNQYLGMSFTLRSFNAISTVCSELIMNLFNKDQPNQQEIEEVTKIIIPICNELRNLYWGAGFILSAIYTFLLGCYFTHSDEDRANVLFEQSVKDVLCAILLESNDFSKQILNEVTCDKGISGFYANDNDVLPKNTDELSRFAKKYVSASRYSFLQQAAEREITGTTSLAVTVRGCDVKSDQGPSQKSI